MNNLQNVLCNTGDNDMTIESVKLIESKGINVQETIFAVTLAIVGCVSIWKAISLVITFINRIN